MQLVRNCASFLSGGLHSAVSTYLLRKRGLPVTAIFLKSKFSSPKTLERRSEIAAHICKQLDVPLEVVDLPQIHWDHFIDQLIPEIRKGNKPNLDPLFHKSILFGSLYRHVVDKLGVDVVATGHWARTAPGKEYCDPTGETGVTMRLLKAVDLRQDESHRLSQVMQKCFQKTAFPMGEFTHEIIPQIMEISQLNSILPMLESVKDDVNWNYETVWEHLHSRVTLKPGAVLDIHTGDYVCDHQGLALWEIGDNIGDDKEPMYVAGKNLETNEIVVVKDAQHNSLQCDYIFTSLAHWAHYTPYNFFEKHTMDCSFVHKGGPAVPCTLTVGTHNEYCGNDHLILSSSQPIRAASSGDYIALYQGEECIGGARILRSGPSKYVLTSGKLQTPSAKSSLKQFISNMKLFSFGK